MCTSRRSICYPYSRHPLQAQAPFKLSVMACHSLARTGKHFVPVREFNLSMPASLIKPKTPLPDGFAHRPTRAISPLAQEALWSIVVLATRTDCKFSLGLNLLFTFGARLLRGLGDSTYFPCPSFWGEGQYSKA